ncbi:hypothetical protein N9T13_00390 [Candidatus Pelagibacter sp.]|nr:hypothetical protein [Candidatus Pelagibacter sp.]
MKRLLLILILMFSFQTLTKADDIRDFEVEGISLGDSLLDYYSKKEIKNKLLNTPSTYTNGEIKRVWFNLDNPKIYSTLNIHFLNNQSYEIVSLGGIEYFINDMTSCYSKQDQAINDMKNTFPNASANDLEIYNHESGKIVKATVRDLSIFLDNGSITISCTDWSKETTSNHNWTDSLGIYLETDEFTDWITNKAFE